MCWPVHIKWTSYIHKISSETANAAASVTSGIELDFDKLEENIYLVPCIQTSNLFKLCSGEYLWLQH